MFLVTPTRYVDAMNKTDLTNATIIESERFIDPFAVAEQALLDAGIGFTVVESELPLAA